MNSENIFNSLQSISTELGKLIEHCKNSTCSDCPLSFQKTVCASLNNNFQKGFADATDMLRITALQLLIIGVNYMTDEFVLKINGLYYSGEGEIDRTIGCVPVWGTGSFFNMQRDGTGLTQPLFTGDISKSHKIPGMVNVQSVFNNVMRKIRDADLIEIIKLK